MSIIKSLQILVWITLAAIDLAQLGCASSQPDPKIRSDRQRVNQELGSEISLKEDREKLDSLRQNENPEKKQENDELALILNQTTEVKEDPARIRERFQQLVQKKRSRFNSKADHLRKQVDGEARQRRDDFMKLQNGKRDAFKKKKQSPEDTRQFYSDLEKERLDFGAKERDRKKDFEDEFHDQQKAFSDYMRERIDGFNEQMRIYAKRYEEAKRQKPAVNNPAPASDTPKAP